MAKTKRLEQIAKEKMLGINRTKPHPVKNKLEYALRYDRLWHTKTITDKKKENKKKGGYISEDITE